MTDRKRALALPWHDTRPLIVMAGDSQIEFGDWYGLFGGAFAIRNCGLSRAKIEDVTSLVSNIGDPNPKMMVLMCGVNSLNGKNPVSTCISNYMQLLSTVNTSIHPQRLIVLSVMPVRESALDQASHEFNRRIVTFNSELETLCPRYKAEFINVNSVVMDSRGGLAADLTPDGLHLNLDGYRKIAGVLAPVLAKTL